MNIQIFFEYELFNQHPKCFKGLGTLILARRTSGEALTISEHNGTFAVALFFGNEQKPIEVQLETIDQCLDYLGQFIRKEVLTVQCGTYWLFKADLSHLYNKTPSEVLERSFVSLEDFKEALKDTI